MSDSAAVSKIETCAYEHMARLVLLVQDICGANSRMMRGCSNPRTDNLITRVETFTKTLTVGDEKVVLGTLLSPIDEV
jgi:hypothetical protein